MKCYVYLLFLFIFALCFQKVDARSKHLATASGPLNERNYKVDFIRNDGQWNAAARFKAYLKDGVFFLTDSGFVYHFAAEPQSALSGQEDSVKYHAFSVTFASAHRQAECKGNDVRAYHHNYYIGNNKAKWASEVPVFGQINRQQIYNGIDLKVYSEDHNLKYDFIVAPGAEPEQIKLKFDGVVPQLTVDGHLRLVTSVNEVLEQKPYCYQIERGEIREVVSSYRVNGQVVTFDFPNGYNTSLPLIIDPVVVFSSYSGASYIPPPNYYAFSGFPAHATTYDAVGKLYSSVTINTLGWPVTMGAYQAIPSTKRDIGINVFEANGTSLAYATYFGGNQNEIALTMLTNAQGDLFIAGNTSSTDLPTTTGCYDSTYNGSSTPIIDQGTDIFVAHFSNNGSQLIGATYLGGSENELVPASLFLTVVGIGTLNGLNIITPIEIVLDSLNNIWILSNTISTDFPVTANAQQPTFSGGQTDIVLCKLNADCSQLLYSSYMGSSGFDIGSSIIFNKSGNLLICGATSGSNFPVTPGAYLTSAPGGTADAFVSIINPLTGGVLQSTFLGTNLADHACIVQVDPADNVYVVGRTYGAYPVTTDTFGFSNGDVFLQKLSPNLTNSLASTRLGNSLSSPSRMIPTGFVYTDCDEVIFSGVGHIAAFDSLPVTPDAVLVTPSKFWFCSLSPNFSTLNTASFFGSVNNLDFRYCGTSHYAPDGTIYQSLGSSTFTTFPTTANAWSPTTQIVQIIPKEDAVSFKIGMNNLRADFVLDAAVNTNDSGCAPYSILPVNTSVGAIDFIWDFGDGSPLITSATPPIHTYASPGNYTITLIASNDSACVIADTAFLSITVLAPAVMPDLILNDTVLCTDVDTLNLFVQINNFNPSFEILWTPPLGLLSAANQQSISVNPYINTTYYVTVTDDVYGLCSLSATDSIHIVVAPNLIQFNSFDTAVCEGTVLQVSANGNPQYTYTWIPGTGMNDSSVINPTISVLQSENYILKASYPGCADTLLFLSIEMQSKPTVNLGPDKNTCPGLPVALESLISPYRSDYVYTWTPTTGLMSSLNLPNAWFISDTSILYTLTVQTPAGCTGADSIYILVYPGVAGGVVPDTGYCPGGYAQLNAYGGTVYRWSPVYGLNDVNIANPTANPETSTDYTVVISNQFNCADTQTVSVQVYPAAVLQIPDTVVLYPGETYQLLPGTNCHYFSWFPPSGISSVNMANPVFDPEVRTRYFVTATTEYGCEVKDSMDVLVNETIWDVPNAFAPNSSNNLFKPSVRGLVQLTQFDIYNRWGNKVYSGSDISSGWDGTYNGVPQPLGVYIYVLEGITDKGKVAKKQGNVTLIR